MQTAETWQKVYLTELSYANVSSDTDTINWYWYVLCVCAAEWEEVAAAAADLEAAAAWVNLWLIFINFREVLL